MILQYPSTACEDLEARVWELATACPVNQDNPEGCQLHHVRTMTIEARIAWIKSLDTQALLKITHNHRACLLAKELLRTFE